ncbi:MAG: M14 family zinc carboxypeptidase, partial [Wenzhouxiangellaceae bacterium]
MFGGDAVAIRLDAVEELQENRFRLTISPESTPINPSPWYGFEVRADEPRTVQLEFDYGSGQHRYWPKISRDQGKSWQPADPDATEEIDGRLHLKLALDEQSTLVFAQPPIGPRDIENWLSRHPAGDRLWMSKAGESVQGREIPVVAFGSWKPGTPLLIIVARQHPPETTSSLAMMKFVDTLLGDTSLARRFRRQVHTLVFPMANPDGVILGHWRGNARGVDLNRDWGSFRQPETRAIRNSIERTVRIGGTRPMLAIDF